MLKLSKKDHTTENRGWAKINLIVLLETDVSGALAQALAAHV